MGNVLLYLEHTEGHLRTASLPAITFGKQAAEAHGGQLWLILVGPHAQQAAAGAAKYGAAGVIAVEDPQLEHVLAETYAPVIARVAKEKGATLVAASATNVGK